MLELDWPELSWVLAPPKVQQLVSTVQRSPAQYNEGPRYLFFFAGYVGSAHGEAACVDCSRNSDDLPCLALPQVIPTFFLRLLLPARQQASRVVLYPQASSCSILLSIQHSSYCCLLRLLLCTLFCCYHIAQISSPPQPHQPWLAVELRATFQTLPVLFSVTPLSLSPSCS